MYLRRRPGWRISWSDVKLELSLKSYLELVLANNTDIEHPEADASKFQQNAITRAWAISIPSIAGSLSEHRGTPSPPATTLAGAATLTTLTQPLASRYQQTLDTGTTYNVGFSGNKALHQQRIRHLQSRRSTPP